MNRNRVTVCVALLAGILLGAIIPVLHAQTATPAAARTRRYHQFCENYTGPNADEQLTSEANRRGRAGYIITGHAVAPSYGVSVCFTRELP